MTSLGDKVFEYSRPKLESMVDDFIEARPFIGRSPPVDVDVILLHTKDVKAVRAVPLLEDYFRTHALVLAPIFMHRDLVVMIDEGIMNRRNPAPYNMAIAEELAHIELHRAVMLQIQSPEDFFELQQHPRWAIAEHDAKYFGRALLMPRRMLESVAADTYRRVSREIGFGDPALFNEIFTTHIAATFEAPRDDAQKRIDRYVGGLRTRIDRSIATASERLLGLADEVIVKRSRRNAEWGTAAPQ